MGNVKTDEKLNHMLDAEWAVIGAMLVDPDVVRPLLSRVRDADFSNPANRLIFQTARSLFRAGITPDAVTIRDKIGPDYSRSWWRSRPPLPTGRPTRRPCGRRPPSAGSMSLPTP